MSDEELTRPREIAERVRRWRSDQGWTQRELAKRANLSPATISRIELGTEQPLGRTAQALASALGVELTRLLGASGQAALFPTADEQRVDLVRRIVELPDSGLERAYPMVRRALDLAASPAAPARRSGRGHAKKGES